MKSALDHRIVRRNRRLAKTVQCLRLAGVGLFLLLTSLGVFSYTRTGGGTRVYAAASTELNFQARLLNNAGAIVADGNSYSVQFKLYDASSGGTNEWTETQNSLTVKAGYLSVHLGSVTPFASTIDWSQEHWLTMNVNGDGEMNPRLKLTAVPLALRAAQADKLTNGSATLAASDLAQLSPSSVQSVNSALTLLRLNQTGAGGLLQLQTGSSDVFTIANNADLTSNGSATFKGGTATLGTTSQRGSLVLNDGAGKTGTLTTAALGSNRTYTLPDASGTICVSSGNCGGTGDINQNGNTLGVDISIGTNDSHNLKFRTGGTNQLTLDTSGNLSFTGGGSITGLGPNLTAVGGLTIASSGANDLNVTSGSGVVVLGANTTLKSSTGLTFDLNNAADQTLTLLNNGAGAANLNLSDGGLAVAGTTVLTNARVLQNVTANTSILTSGTLGAARGGTGLDGSGATNGQLLIGNGSGFSLGSLANNGGLTITTGVGTLGLAVNYGSSSTSAVRGDTTLTCASGTGNLSGGGGAITLGSGGSCGSISISNSPSFTTSVTTPTLTSSSGLALSSGGTGDISLDSASNKLVIATSDTLLQHVASGDYTVDLKDSGLTRFVLDNSGTGTSDLNLNDGGLEIAGTTVLTNSRVLQNVTLSAGLVTSGTLSASRGGTGLDGSGATNGQLLIGNGSGFSLGSLANNGGLTITPGSGTLGLAVNYGSTSTTAVRGDTTLTCASGSGNLTGGGGLITLGTGASCGSISTNNAVSFTTSVTTPLLTNSGALTINTADSTSVSTSDISIKSGNASLGSNLNAGTITLDTGTKTGAGTSIINIGNTNATSLVLGNSNTALSLNGSGLTLGAGLSAITRTAAGATTFDLKDTANTTIAFTNSGNGSLNLTTDGAITAGNGLTVSASGASITGGLTASGTISLNGATTISPAANSATALTVNGTTGAAATAVDIAQTGDAANLVMSNTARTSGALISLTQSTSAFTGTGLLFNFASGSGSFASGNFLDFQVNGTSKFKIGNTGALAINTDSTSALSINGATSGLSILSADATNGLVTVGSATSDTSAVVFVLDSKSGTDPTGVQAVNGASYYSTTTNTMRCYENGAWNDCNLPSIRSFIDTTAVAIVDANTTNYWRLAAENNNSYPNLTPRTTNKAIMGIVTMEVVATSNNDLEASARIERGIGSVPTCGSGTQVGAQPGIFASNTGGQKASTVTFVDTPNTTQKVYYVLCSDLATVGTAGNVTRIRITLQEVNNSNN